MKKNNKKLKLFSLIFLILFCLYFQTVVYSAINSTMTIKGNAYARVDADVRITNFKLSSSSSNSTSSYEEFSVNTIASKFNLVNSSSSIVFDVEVTNYGSSDVGILQLVGTVPTGLSYEIINYNLKDKICDDTGKCNQMAVKTFQIKFTGTPGEYEVNLELDFRTYHKVTYTDVTNNNYPTEVIDGGNLNITFKEDLKRVSVLSNGVEVNYYNQISNGQMITIENVLNDIEIKKKEPVAKLVSGKIDEVGSEVCIKDECFYIISNDGSTVSMLAKYNLYVGGKYENNTWIAYGDEATGKQDSNMLGYISGQSVRKGTTAFSETNYWYDEALKSEYGDTIPAYVFDSNSLIYNYMQNYDAYLNSVGVLPLSVRLITRDELISLGCEISNNSCIGAPSWVYSASYWTGTAGSNVSLYSIIGTDLTGYSYNLSARSGVRPVIEMSVDDIYVPPVAKVISGDLDTVGSEICIDTECFYVISSTDDTVTMFAKHNLYVGNECSSSSASSCIAYGEEATGKQDSTMLGLESQSIRKGTTKFSDTNYWSGTVSSYPTYVYNSNSTLYNYVENYKTYLSTLGVTLSEARLITSEELTILGCGSLNCKNAPSWVYSTSYWSGDTNSYISGYCISSSGNISDAGYANITSFGVRPVITISKSDF